MPPLRPGRSSASTHCCDAHTVARNLATLLYEGSAFVLALCLMRALLLNGACSRPDWNGFALTCNFSIQPLSLLCSIHHDGHGAGRHRAPEQCPQHRHLCAHRFVASFILGESFAPRGAACTTNRSRRSAVGGKSLRAGSSVTGTAVHTCLAYAPRVL